MKKFFCCFIIAFCLFGMNFSQECLSKTKDMKPLKLEQNYEYGNLAQTMENPKISDSEDDFSNIINNNQRKEPSIIKIFNSLIFVVFLILLTGWGYMKFKKINPEQLLSGKFKNLSENNFKIISSLQLGAGKSIYLIEINNKQLIVGTTASNVNLLAQMDKNATSDEAIEKILEEKTQDLKKLED